MSGSAFDIVLDELTLARARRGDLRACEAIYRLYQGPAYTIAFRICQCPAQAQDVLQEAFIKVFKRLRQFRGDAPFWGWLRRVIVNQAISQLRRQPEFAALELNDFHAISEGDHGRVELCTDLAEAFGQLDAQDRSVVWLHDVEGYNHTEIAQLFGMTESFSKTRLSRARARLRELLGQHMNPGQPIDEYPGGDVGGRSRAPALRGTGASLHNGSLAADQGEPVASKARSHSDACSHSRRQLAADQGETVASKARSYNKLAPAFGES